jgi:hypothetical protein
MYEIDFFIKLTFFEEFSEFGLIIAFLDISHTIFAVQWVTFGLLFVQCGMLLDRQRHRLRTPSEAFFNKKSKLWGLGRLFGQITLGAFGVFSADLSAPIWVL